MPSESHAEVLQEILQYLKTHVDGIEHIVLIRSDGTQLSELSSSETSGVMGTVMTEFGHIAGEVCRLLEVGPQTEALIKGKQRFFALYGTRSKHTLLGILGQSSVNLGLLNSGARSAIEKIEAIISD